MPNIPQQTVAKSAYRSIQQTKEATIKDQFFPIFSIIMLLGCLAVHGQQSAPQDVIEVAQNWASEYYGGVIDKGTLITRLMKSSQRGALPFIENQVHSHLQRK